MSLLEVYITVSCWDAKTSSHELTPTAAHLTPLPLPHRPAWRDTQADEEGLKAKIATWNPKEDKKAQGDAYKTLFIAKISYDTTEKKLRREFEQYGPINTLRMVQDEDGKPRG